MRIFKTKPFVKFAEQEGIEDSDLCEAVTRAERGLIDADLGGGVIKQRIARRGQGKSRGYRTIIFFLEKHRAFFAHGFAKRDQDNVSRKDLAIFRKLSAVMLAYSDAKIDQATEEGLIFEVEYHE